MSFSRYDPSPRGTPHNPDRRSVRVALAAELLRHGRTAAQVADTTQVPFALVEWIAEQIRHTARDQGEQIKPPRRIPVDTTNDRVSGAAAQTDSGSAFPRPRWRTLAAAAITVGWLLDCTLSVLAVADPQPSVTAAAAILNAALATIMIATRLRRGINAAPRKETRRP